MSRSDNYPDTGGYDITTRAGNITDPLKAYIKSYNINLKNIEKYNIRLKVGVSSLYEGSWYKNLTLPKKRIEKTIGNNEIAAPNIKPPVSHLEYKLKESCPLDTSSILPKPPIQPNTYQLPSLRHTGLPEEGHPPFSNNAISPSIQVTNSSSSFFSNSKNQTDSEYANAISKDKRFKMKEGYWEGGGSFSFEMKELIEYGFESYEMTKEGWRYVIKASADPERFADKTDSDPKAQVILRDSSISSSKQITQLTSNNKLLPGSKDEKKELQYHSSELNQGKVDRLQVTMPANHSAFGLFGASANKAALINDLIKKYKLPDSSQPSLEKGLRMAVINNEVNDLNEFIALVNNINAQGAKLQLERTALHWAAIKKHRECYELLLQKGADPNILDATGKKPLEYLPTSSSCSIQ